MIGEHFGIMRKDSRHAHAWIEDDGSSPFAALAKQTGLPSVAALEEGRGRSQSASLADQRGWPSLASRIMEGFVLQREERAEEARLSERLATPLRLVNVGRGWPPAASLEEGCKEKGRATEET